MNKIWSCRRTFLGALAIVCLTGLGYTKDVDVSMALAGVVASVAAANSYEKRSSVRPSIDK